MFAAFSGARSPDVRSYQVMLMDWSLFGTLNSRSRFSFSRLTHQPLHKWSGTRISRYWLPVPKTNRSRYGSSHQSGLMKIRLISKELLIWLELANLNLTKPLHRPTRLQTETNMTVMMIAMTMVSAGFDPITIRARYQQDLAKSLIWIIHWRRPKRMLLSNSNKFKQLW